MTLENTPAAAYLRTEEKQNARVMEADGSVSLRDSGISDATTTQPSSSSVLSCILCMECIGDWNALKRHLLKNHEVKREALHAFMSLVDHPKLASSSPADDESNSWVIDLGNNDELTEKSREAANVAADYFCGGSSKRSVDRNDRSAVECGACSATFPDCAFLFKHQDETDHLVVRMTSAGPRYVCWHAECGQTFSTVTLLRCHFVNTHAVKSDGDATTTAATSELTEGADRFQCHQCDQVLKKREEFRMHCYCHKMEKAMECCSCGTRFSSIHEFRKHKQVVHNEELTSEQQELYEASIAAASSLALLGASGLEYMTNHSSKTSNLMTTVRKKDTLSGEADLMTTAAVENSAAEDKMDPRLDENSNQSKFVGIKGSVGIAEDTEVVNCSHNGLLHNKCFSCKTGFDGTNSLTDCQQKHKRKRSNPSKVISDLSKQNLISGVCTVGKSMSYSRDKSMLDLRASIGNKNPLIESAALTSQLPVLVNTTLSNSSSSAVSQSGRLAHPLQPTDRPFRCSLCKVSYTQKMQLDSHLSSQQHLSRCAKISDPLIRQRASTSSMQMMLPFAGNQADQVNQFAELMRQQNVLIPSFLPFGVPMVNPLMMPLLTNCVAPSLGRPFVEADVMSASSTATTTTATTTTTKQISAAGKSLKHQEVEPKSEPVSDLNPTSKLSLCNDVAEKTEYSCSRCCETFSSVEQLDRHKEEIECPEVARNILAPDLNSSGCNKTMMESILQRIGYECVKQFNEYRQKPKQSSRHVSNSEFGKGSLEDSKSSCETQEARNVEEPENERNENNKYFCWMCSKSFSTIFVLKAHQEQVHNQIIPIDAIEKLHNELKANQERIFKQECSERSDTSGQKRQHEIFPLMRQASAEEEIKLKQQQQQQIQIAAAIQNMQMNLMLSSGILPQVFQRLPGSSHIASLPPELFAPQPFPIIDPMLMVQLQQRQSTQSMTLPIASPTQLSSAAAANQKSARTRISEQQLQVLRANFDINNSPTEEQIQEMSEKTGLVTKVIKHWFRNTLFKERQRNKDSPYNFNVPPVTTLSLSDCERMPMTSSAKEMSSSSDENSVNTSNFNSDLLSEPRSGSAVTDSAAKPEMADESISNVERASFSQMPSRSEDKIALSSSQGTSEFKLMDPQHGINLNAVMMNNLYNIPHGAERRAGRTRFSNHQNQVLQEFFDRNPYPKDDEVEALSRALNLRVRVIVVWFQNARQRIRKTEGHTLLAEGTKQAQFLSGMSGFSSDQQIELLQHQLTEHSVSKGSGQGPSSSNQVSIDDEEQGSGSSLGNEPEYDNTGRKGTEEIKLECNWAFEFADRLNEHQREMQSSQNPSILSPSSGSTRPQLHFNQRLLPELNQKMMEDGAYLQQTSDSEEHRADRRMRTTLAQDQLEYLYQKFAAESNPSRSALEAIAAHLNLKPRVVQVWFQNTRARERRGQHRVNSQKSLVRCPFCSSMFRGKIALEAHQAEQHPQSINNIGYPVDLVRNMQGMSSGMESVIPPFLAPSPMMTAAGISTLQSNMHYLYEKSFQEYMSKLTNLHTPTQQMAPSASSSSSNQSIQSAPITKPSKQTTTKSEDGPLDLTTSSVATRNDRNGQLIPEVVDSSHSLLFAQNLDDSYSETYSENDENGGFRGVDNMSPSALGTNPSCSGAMFAAGKRYRTQMSSLQIRVLRAIFSSYKTPSLAECEILGQQIGLGKRVVQVWFQNSRAKEKKANFPGFEKSDGIGAGGNTFFPQLGNSPASCCLCNVTYGINHTMQDHLFTKMHIDRVKVVVNSSEFGKSFPNIAFGESGDSFDQHKQFSSKNPLPMIKPMTNSPTVISTRTLELAADMHSSSNNHSVSFERNSKRQFMTLKKGSRGQPRGQPGDSEKNVQNSAPIPSPSMAFVNPLDARLRQFAGVPPAPTDLLGAMMPYLYPGGAIPPVLPGFNPIQLLSQAPNILPNMAYALLNSAAACGIQLVQLQIPKRAIEQIQDRLKDKTCVLATYSEDCLTSTEVKTHLDSGEITWLVEEAIHVGYICKRCHLVFPQVDACNAHQMALCFKGAEHFGDSVLKLEQRRYQCSCCKVHCVTAKEFKAHCAQEDHRKAVSPGVGSFMSRTNSTTSSPGASQRLVDNVIPKEGQSPLVADVKLEKEDV